MANPTSRGQQRDKPFRDALRMELAALGDDSKALRAIARSLIAAASEGKMDAIKEIGDRMDGKPAQESTVDITTTRFVARLPNKAETSTTWQKQNAPKSQTIQ